MDQFTQKRIVKFVEDFRSKSGQLPTIQDFEVAGFNREKIDTAKKLELLEEFYLTLTNGSIVKAYKLKK